MSGHKRGRRGVHRQPDEPFLMLTKSMAQNPAILDLSPIAAKALHLFYRAHIHYDDQGKAWFPMPRSTLATLLKVSLSTADRVLAELEAAKLIVQQGKRALRKPACYRLALPPAQMPAERNDELHEPQPRNPHNVVMGDDIEASNVVMGDEVEAFNVVTGDDTRARTLDPVGEVSGAGGVSTISASLSVGRDHARTRARARAHARDGGGWWCGYDCAKQGECLQPSSCGKAMPMAAE